MICVLLHAAITWYLALATSVEAIFGSYKFRVFKNTEFLVGINTVKLAERTRRTLSSLPRKD